MKKKVAGYKGNFMACVQRNMIRIIDVKPGSKGCEECLKRGDRWVHLRICLTCGHVGCCNESKNRHTTKHFEETGNPVIQSYQPGEDWTYCYIYRKYLEQKVDRSGFRVPKTSPH